MGSPCAVQLSPSLAPTALLQRDAHRMRSSTSDVFQIFRTTIFPVVSVPVLLQHMSPIPPSASIESRLRTIALRRAICVTPLAMVMATTAVRDSGIIANARAIAYRATSEVILNREIAKTMMTRINAVIREYANFASLSQFVMQRGYFSCS